MNRYPTLLLAMIFLFGFSFNSCKKNDSETSSKQQTPTTNPDLPTITINETAEVTLTTAKLFGEVVSEGKAAVGIRGFCWGTEPNVSVNNEYSGNEFGPGKFDHLIENLEPLTTYYAKAYATNAFGTVYSNEISFTTVKPSIGAAFKGGIVIYIDGSGDHGLIVSKDDLTAMEWGCMGTALTDVEWSEIGKGKSNTQNIVSQCSDFGCAARVCDDYEFDGYDDWYLPSFDELYQIYLNRNILTNLNSDGQSIYWSSTQFNLNPSTVAKGIDFENYDPNIGGYYKYSIYNIRAVRAY